MKLKESIKRLHFTLSEKNKPNHTDIEAFNNICLHLQKEEQKTIQENLLFTKLYAYNLGKFASHYNNIDAANKHLNKILAQPITATIDILLMELKAMEVRQVFEDDFLKELNPTDVKKTFEKYPDFQKDFLSCWDYWDKDNVISHLNANINLSIQNFKNHV